MRDYFDRVVVISLPRRGDRLARFFGSLDACDWPFARPQVVRGIDAAFGTVPTPRGFSGPPGGFGCTRSHARVIEDALMDDVGSILVLEDDAVFAPDFGPRVREFLARVPADWNGLLLGGQHTFAPRPVCDGVVKCLSTYRTHAYAARGEYLCALSYVWGMSAVTLDHEQAQIVAAFNVYAPDRFIAGQGGGTSEITGESTAPEFWNQTPTPFVHGQDVGDVIYGLPAMRDAGGGRLVLFHDPRNPYSHKLTLERYGLVERLLRIQPYIRSVEHKDAWQVIPTAFNDFRRYCHDGATIVNSHYDAMGMSRPVDPSPWLTVDRTEHAADVLFARSPRWPSPHRAAIWRTLHQAYGDRAAFVGTEPEWRDFQSQVGPVRFVPTADFLELARVVAGCKLFCGSQSAPLAIASGLGKKCVVEVCPPTDNCRLPGHVAAVDGSVELSREF